MWMKGSRSATSTPAKARRTGKPSPSSPRGAVVIDFTRRGRSVVSGATTRGSSSGFSTEMAGMASAYRPRRRLGPDAPLRDSVLEEVLEERRGVDLDEEGLGLGDDASVGRDARAHGELAPLARSQPGPRGHRPLDRR